MRDGRAAGAHGMMGIVVQRLLGLAALAGRPGRENYKARRPRQLGKTDKLSRAGRDNLSHCVEGGSGVVAELGSERWEGEVEVRLGLSAPPFGPPRLQHWPHPGPATAPRSLWEERPPRLQGLGPSAPLPPRLLPLGAEPYVSHTFDGRPEKLYFNRRFSFSLIPSFISRYLIRFVLK